MLKFAETNSGRGTQGIGHGPEKVPEGLGERRGQSEILLTSALFAPPTTQNLHLKAPANPPVSDGGEGGGGQGANSIWRHPDPPGRHFYLSSQVCFETVLATFRELGL